MDPIRRRVVRSIAAGGSWVGITAVSGFMGGLTGTVGERTLNTIFKDKDVPNAEKGAIDFLCGEDSGVPSIYAGEGNLLRSDTGSGAISSYLTFAASTFSSYLGKALELTSHYSEDNSSDAFVYDRRRSSIFLGGPAANRVTCDLLGYKHISVPKDATTIPMPVVDRGNRRTRWGQVYGETAYGVFGGKLEIATRYSSTSGKAVQRPLYKILDKATGEMLAPTVKDGWLLSEWLTVARLREGTTFKVVIGGMHGYSTEAFCRNITASIENLERVVGSAQQYQVIIPVSLDHRRDLTGRAYTHGELDWRNARFQKIEG